MSTHFLTISTAGAAPDEDGPPPERIVSGAPRFRTWNVEERDGLYAGIWEATPGKWRIVYDEWEFCHIISGEVILTEEGKRKGHRFKKGDGFIIPPGFKGTWETVKKVRKHYVILMPKGKE